MPANPHDREWAAQLMAKSEPWLTLRRSLDTSRAVLNDPEFQVFVARSGQDRCGFLILDPRGVAGAPYLKSLATIDGYRGRGIGTGLVRQPEGHSPPPRRY